MAISIDWGTLTILVPKADTTLVDIGPPEIRELDIDAFRQTLNALQAAQPGIPFPTTHVHTAPLAIAGVTLARVVEIINGYTIQFENLQYSVNIVGGNSNIGDVKVQNQVSVNTANSAGLVTGLDETVEERGAQTINVIEALRTILDAVAIGNVIPPGAYPGTLYIRDADDTKNRVTVTVAADGTRTVTALDKD